MPIPDPRRLLPSLPMSLSAVLLASLLAACSSTPAPPPPPDTRQVDAWIMHGYLSDTRRPVERRDDSFALPGGVAEAEWILPQQGTALPLVVYLPGLGESQRAGERWRRAWATAGYAVLALAAGEDDRPPPALLRRVDKPDDGSPPPANVQELRQRLADQRDARHEWARQRYQPDAAAARMQRLVATLSVLEARAVSGDPLVQRIQLQQVALAGYDAGAYTALLAVGELPHSGWTAPPLPVNVRAVIALSPYADFGGTAFAQRYRQVQVPVLSVSGASDADAAGLVPSPFVRRAPFENLPGHASLLWLRGGSHAMLSGRAEGRAGVPDAGAPADEPDQAGGLPRAGGGRGGNPGGRGSGMRAGGMDAGGFAAAGGEESEASRARQATDNAIEEVIVTATTVAFLDAELKHDGLARQWLASDAARWIRPRGEWHQR